MESMPARIESLILFVAVRVRGDLASRFVGLVGGDLQLFEGKLLGAGTVSFGEHAAGAKNLDHVDAVLHLRAHDVTHLIRTVGNLVVALRREERDAGLGRVVIQVAVAARDRNSRPAGHHARTDDVSLVDVVAQINSHERTRADVAHGREAGQSE